MSYTVDITEVIYFTIVRSVLLAFTSDMDIIRGQVNRVAQPTNPDYIVMTPLQRDLIELPIVTWDHSDANAVTINMLTPQKITMQIDVHGPNAADNCSLVAAVLRSPQGYDLFVNACANLLASAQYPLPQGLVISPLYSDQPKQVPFINGANQYEDRWLVEIAVQADINITITQDFANALALGLISVDAKYPP